MNAFRLLQIQLELECITFDHNGDLMRLPCPDPEDVPRVHITQHAQGISILFRQDVPPSTRQAINALPQDTAFHSPQIIQNILERDAPVRDMWNGASYVVAQRIAPDAFPDVTREDRALRSLFRNAAQIEEAMVYAVMRDGHAVSACESARENTNAGEAWVRTEPAYQHNGYAAQTVCAWAYDLQQKNKIPFYSHKRENIASEKLARALGLTLWAANVIFL